MRKQASAIKQPDYHGAPLLLELPSFGVLRKISILMGLLAITGTTTADDDSFVSHFVRTATTGVRFFEATIGIEDGDDDAMQEGLVAQDDRNGKNSNFDATSTLQEEEENEMLLQHKLQFDRWMTKHNKRYCEKEEEYLYRFKVFVQNSNIVEQHNLAYEHGWTSFAMSLDGPFSDLTNDEFSTAYLMQAQNCSATHVSSGSVKDLLLLSQEEKAARLPTFVDWRTKGVITPIKNQRHCGSCWTFSTTGTLEAHHCIAAAATADKGTAEDCTHWTGLSEQQLLDCAADYNNQGCDGGLPSQAFEYIHYNGGIMTEDNYPYQGEGGNCHTKKEHSRFGAKVLDVFNLTSYAENEIVTATAKFGPVSVAYQVASDFRFYSHGVYDSYNATTNTTNCLTDPQHVNHAVVVVGYGDTTTALTTASGSSSNNDELSSSGTTHTPIPFYIVRNSWGNTWGMEGYFWMKRGINLCGISDCASFPLVPNHPTTMMSSSSSAATTTLVEQETQQQRLLRDGKPTERN